MVFEFLDLKPRNPFFSLALDQALCEYMGLVKPRAFKAGIRLWTNPPAVVLGRTDSVTDNVTDDLIAHARQGAQKPGRGLPVLCRRVSGGGTVLHGPGNLNFTVFLPLAGFPHLFSVTRSYEVILELIQKALYAQSIDVRREGKSDLVLSGGATARKISGNAQFRKHGIIVHHGTLITRPELVGSVSKFLRHPPREPDYRGGRTHESFLGSLPDSFDDVAFYQCLSSELRHFAAAGEVTPLPSLERHRIGTMARKLVKNTYAHPAWIFDARSPELDPAAFENPSPYSSPRKMQGAL
ncbi:MAG: lipoate--protein ligase family protein [Spirochaetia bacterium]|nr:lipoate--protein ligase family protein [Spirochaetia bacterium]